MKNKSLKAAKKKILATAIEEFSRNGFAGARVDAIGRKSGYNKGMIYYYFKNKKNLYLEVLEHLHSSREYLESAPDDPAEYLLYWQKLNFSLPEEVRLLLWEGLEFGNTEIPGEKSRKKYWSDSAAKIKNNQGPGKWPPFFDPQHALISWIGMVCFPLAFPQICRLITGQSVSDPEFIEKRETFLKAFADFMSGKLK